MSAPSTPGSAPGSTPGSAPQAPARGRRTPLAWWRDSWQAWWQARLKPTDNQTLGQRNIYIVPTRGGLAFALLMALMLLASINYQLNLGFVLSFMLAGAALVSMHITHGMLRGLNLRLKVGPPVVAGEPALMDLVITNPGGQRYGLAVRLHDRERHGRSYSAVDVPALGQAQATVSIVPARRGWHAVPALVVETGFPFGLFRAWTVWRPSARVLAWPRPEKPAPPLPPALAVPGGPHSAHQVSGGELEGVRAWRRGDTLRQVVWKKVARSGEMVSRETSSAGSQELWLDWAAAASGDLEGRLSRLAAWVDVCERSNLAWGLRLPGSELPVGQGEAHRREAMQRLALWA